MATAKDKADEKATTDAGDGSAFTDIEKAQETLVKEAQDPQVNDEGIVETSDAASQAAEELADEGVRRASASANGGGPWPPELLLAMCSPRAVDLREPVYTSHEDADNS